MDGKQSELRQPKPAHGDMGVPQELYANKVTFGMAEEWCDCLHSPGFEYSECAFMCVRARVRRLVLGSHETIRLLRTPLHELPNRVTILSTHGRLHVATIR